MRDSKYKPTIKTARRAAELWKKMLTNPKFDNGDDSVTGFMTASLASMIPTNTTEELLDAFVEKLVEKIMTPSAHNPDFHDSSNLSVDYGPCQALADSAKAVGLNCQFPWKTSTRVYSDEVHVRHGYGAETIFHYALDNDKWLVTTLSGSEIEKIKRYIVDGDLLEFTVEG